MSHLVQITLGVINDDMAAHWIELAEVRTNQRTHTHTHTYRYVFWTRLFSTTPLPISLI